MAKGDDAFHHKVFGHVFQILAWTKPEYSKKNPKLLRDEALNFHQVGRQEGHFTTCTVPAQ